MGHFNDQYLDDCDRRTSDDDMLDAHDGVSSKPSQPTMYDKVIRYDRETRDYAMYLSGTLIGFARTYHEAEVTLDQTVYELLIDGHFATAKAMDGGAVEMPEGDWIDVEGMRVEAPNRLVVVQIATEAPESLLDDVACVIDMALGATHGAASVVSELRRIRARIEQVQGRAVTQG